METAECKICEKQIEPFFEDDLDNDELEAFLQHIETCRECREELTIRLLVRIGLERLEDGRTFHLGNEYQRMIRAAKTRLNRRRSLQRFAGLGIGAVILGVVTVVIISWIVLL
ncbi:MAG: zf-HC2 domain-containing protein [Lachnospiraceae bacterium]|nr:zf-HC2 domain-containing protein [Lachnospiraceae bacterium]